MRSFTALLLLGIPAFCQYPEIVTNDDGQQVYFTTLLVERNAPEAAATESRIFRIDGRTVQLFVERGTLARTDVSSSSDGASSVQLTGDGQSVAFVLTNICPTADPCRTTIQRAEIRGRGQTVLGEAQRVLLSRNGKWALLVPPLFSVGLNGELVQPNTQSTLVNLDTGEKTAVGMPLTGDGAFVLASDGSVLQRVQGETGVNIGVGTNGTLTPLPLVSGVVVFLGMSDDKSTVLVSRLNLPPPGQPLTMLPPPDLIALDLHAGTTKVLQSLNSPGRYILLGISNDGHRALLRTDDSSGAGTVMLVDVETSKSTTLVIGEDESPLSGTLSGFGNAAIIATNNGRILRLALDSTGKVISTEELLPVTPYLHPNTFLVAPGALIDVDPPISGNIDWSGRIQFNNLPLAVIRETSRRLTLQVPWELQVGMAAVSIEYPSQSPLVQRTRVFVASQAPRFSTPPSGASGIFGGMLIKSDFSGYVTEPPKPGDIVHMYMTGLGAVRGTVKTGEPAPTNDLRPITGYVHCAFTPSTTDAETLFAGLAPGMVGIYQLDFRFPADTTADVRPTGMRCGFNTPGYNFIMQSVGMP